MKHDGHRWTAGRIADACGGRLIAGDAAVRAHGISTDTRSLSPGQAFVALAGRNFDAHEFLPAAAAAGASVFVIERTPAGWHAPPGCAVVTVPDTDRALLNAAAWHRRRLRARVVAVTGSHGKTTVRDMIGAILSTTARCTVAPRSYNNRIGVALTLLSASARDEFVVLEMGTNHPGEIDELARAARPDLGVITAIAETHLEGLGSLSGVREAKAELIPRLPADGVLVLNADDPRCASLAERFPGATPSFGTSPGATVRVTAMRPAAPGWAFEALGRSFRLPVGGRHNVLNAAAALCATRALGADPDAAAGALDRFSLPDLRYQRRPLGGVTFVLDCYNSNPAALRAAAASFLDEPAVGIKVLVAGEMLELGKRAPALHYDMGRELAASGLDALVAVGPLARHMLRGWQTVARGGRIGVHFDSAAEAAWPVWLLVSSGDAVLVKGSRAARMEVIVERIARYAAGTPRREVA